MAKIKVLWPVSLARRFVQGAIRVLRLCCAQLIALFILFTEGVIDKWWLLSRAERYWYAGIKICGSSDFINATVKALGLLKATSHFESIRRNIYMIKEGRRSGIRVGHWPTFSVGRQTWNSPKRSSSSIWYAGAIAHEAYHNILLFQRRAFSGPKAETRCMAFQLQVLKELEAPLPMLEHIAEQMKNPTYQGNPWSLVDYLLRDW